MNEKEQITIATLGSCVTRDIFRVCDQHHRFKMIRNVGFISPLSMLDKLSGETKELENAIIDCDVAKFEKRNVLLDIRGGIFEYFKSEKADYLVLDIVDIRFPILSRGNEHITVREGKTEGEIIKQKLRGGGINYSE